MEISRFENGENSESETLESPATDAVRAERESSEFAIADSEFADSTIADADVADSEFSGAEALFSEAEEPDPAIPVPGAGIRAEPTLSARVRRNRIIVGASLALIVVVVLGVVIGNLLVAGDGSTPAPGPGAIVEPTATAHPVNGFDRAAHSLDDPESPWVVVNKQRPIVPVDFTPPDLVAVKVPHTWAPLLRADAATAVEAMFAAATSEAGLSLESNSAFRSYASQVEVYTSEVKSAGVAAADLSTARPGTSEHQTGLTIDIGAENGACRFNVCFADTAEGQWLAANAWRFGYLLRYPADKVAVTGYEFEPWHFRYLGTDLSTELHSTGVSTLEEFFELPSAPTY